MEKRTEMLHEESKTKSFQKRSVETSEEVPDKKLKLSPSPLMELPNELWMKILGYLPTCDILKNFNLTCKRFHSLAINPGAIKFLKVKNVEDPGPYQEVVKVLKRSKTLKNVNIDGCKLHMNHILAHALKSNHLKSLEVSGSISLLSKKNAENIKNSNIEILKLINFGLKDDAIQRIGAMKTLKYFKICTLPPLIELAELKASTLKNFLEKTETLKKLYILCNVTKDQNDQNEVKWNANPNMEELYFYGHRTPSALKIEFSQAMPKLTILALSSTDVEMLSVLSTQKFPLLERLYLRRGHGTLNPDLQVIYKILQNCPNLKSVQLEGFDLSDPNKVGERHSFMHGVYKDFDAFVDILSHADNLQFEDYLQKSDLATFEKYKRIKTIFLDSKWSRY